MNHNTHVTNPDLRWANKPCPALLCSSELLESGAREDCPFLLVFTHVMSSHRLYLRQIRQKMEFPPDAMSVCAFVCVCACACVRCVFVFVCVV